MSYLPRVTEVRKPPRLSSILYACISTVWAELSLYNFDRSLFFAIYYFSKISIFGID